MPRGYPDYFGQSIWPKYGTPIDVLSSGAALAPQATEVMFDISSQGILFIVTFGYVATVRNDHHIMTLTIDNVPMTWGRLHDYETFDLPYVHKEMLDFITCNEEKMLYVWGTKKEIPFHTGIKLDCFNANAGGGTTILPYGHAIYYVIT